MSKILMTATVPVGVWDRLEGIAESHGIPVELLICLVLQQAIADYESGDLEISPAGPGADQADPASPVTLAD